MTLFLSGGEAVKQRTAPTPARMGPVDTLWPDHEEGPIHSSTPTAGARPKVQLSTSQPWSMPEGPDPVSHPHRWIHVEMLKISHRYQWKTLMPCGQMMMFAHILYEHFSKHEALAWLGGRPQPSSYLWLNMKLQGGGSLHQQFPDFSLSNTCLPLCPPTCR